MQIYFIVVNGKYLHYMSLNDQLLKYQPTEVYTGYYN